ncbi:unnamed protein product [Miscanthus lutarioriparius]|uniref:Retrotransposon gag domain-containing protein n=1 Tax=Miscanthus lutarioriparius TaxID=422564 RepID=A0A811Q203_9POAL|nr:unnamed protein product [Miscanthus lutarioriparius]
MDPTQKLLLDEMDRRFGTCFDSIDRRFDDLEKKFDGTASSSSTRLDALENATKVFDEWRPGVDGLIDDLWVEVNRLTSLKLEVGKISKFMERSMVDGPSTTPGLHGSMPSVLVAKSSSAPASPSAAVFANNPMRSPALKSSPPSPTFRMAPPSPNYKPELPTLPNTLVPHGGFEAAPRPSAGYAANPPNGHRVNQAGFGVVTTLLPPHAKGEHPKLWIKQAIHYFCLYRVESVVWVSAATMHFHGPAKRWLSSIEDDLESIEWDMFCAQLLSRFGRDEHELLLCRMFRIRQNGSVADYIEQFVSLVDELKAYAKHPNPLYYVQRFIDGLRDDIKAILLVHKTSTLDAACVLAELQEEALGVSKRVFRHSDAVPTQKPAWHGGVPLPIPPPRTDAVDGKRAGPVSSSTTDEKF